MFAVTAQGRRVARHTPRCSQGRIDLALRESVIHHAHHPQDIDSRLVAISREWDIERTLEANAAAISLASVIVGAVTGRRTWLMSGVVAGFLLQHALQGWCPPLPLFRRLGVRSKDEIMLEYSALRLLGEGLDRFEDLRQAAPEERARIVLEVLFEPSARPVSLAA